MSANRPPSAAFTNGLGLFYLHRAIRRQPNFRPVSLRMQYSQIVHKFTQIVAKIGIIRDRCKV